MPKLNGYEACEKIRARPWGKKTLLIAVTGWGQEDDRRRTERAGFDRHLVKPVDPDEVAKILEKEAGDGIDAGGLPGS
jgi:CheY-like chemotaxis protein